MIKIFKIIILMGLVFIPRLSSASSIDVGIAPVWWQYKEISGKLAGYATTPLRSSAQGLGAEVSVKWTQELQDVWVLETGWKGILPLTQGKESWNLGNGVQTNSLNVVQSEVRLDVLRKLSLADIGLWSSYQWHQQSRKHFVVNNVLKNTGLIRETVQSIWAGLELQSAANSGLFYMRLEAALPVWVNVKNTAVADVFNKRSGYRLGADTRFQLPWQGSYEKLSLIAAYQYRELGNDLKTTALWPKNRWQTVSLGINLTW